MTNKKPSLDLAYSLKSVQDNLELYSAWAEDYDQDFASKMDYILPDRVAKTFQDVGGEGPILDVGAGTGLAGYALAKLGLTPIDAIYNQAKIFILSEDILGINNNFIQVENNLDLILNLEKEKYTLSWVVMELAKALFVIL